MDCCTIWKDDYLILRKYALRPYGLFLNYPKNIMTP
ncbi:hypothetical protein BN2476_170163 [Paraburkholderia piptadeniae]|uniref:Uncharacterized protein n=1 Tax=Paraburkholderia piptadeniae TaxID=1701573 RepID=A0A1N7RTS3_9BURK|nr:hypothetical protein BN2476_170163 [Paraburkholderia piptadeniae]